MELSPGRGAEPTGPQLTAASGTLALLAVPTRLHVMWLLSQQPYDVGTLSTLTGASVPVVSQHLAKLRLAGVVSARREGRRQIYAVEDPHMLVLVDQILAHIAPDGSLAPDPPIGRHQDETHTLAQVVDNRGDDREAGSSEGE